MKKVILTGLVSVALSATLAEAKFFVGVQGGYDMSRAVDIAGGSNPFITSAVIGTRGFEGVDYQSWKVGINLGNEWLFNNYFGLRWFFGVNYGQFIKYADINYSDLNISASHLANMEFGLDALVNVVNTGGFSLGFFFGIAGQYNVWLDEANVLTELVAMSTGNEATGGNLRMYMTLLGRAGITIGLGEHSRIDLGASMPIISGGVINNALYNPIQFTAGYKFLF